MGCTFSGSEVPREDRVRSFRVHNVDSQGIELNRGRIEIIDADMILYQKGKEPIKWPLRCLRRYGFDDELFSFESGRRCATGVGIFAFKCAHAEDLFNLVRDSIARAGEEDQRAHNALNHLTPVPETQQVNRAPTGRAAVSQEHEMYGSVPASAGDRSFNTRINNGSAHAYVNGPVVNDASHEYMNTGATRSVSSFQIDGTSALVEFLHNPPGIRSGSSQVNYAELELAPISMENLVDESGDDAIHNVNKRGNRLSQPSLSQGYAGDHGRFSMPNEVVAASSQENDSILQSADSDVFLDVPGEGGVGSNYVNVVVEEQGGMGVALPSASHDVVLPPLENSGPAMNYANIAAQFPKNPRGSKQLVNYIMIEHKAQSSDNLPTGGAYSGAASGTSNNSPTSPTSCTSFPESPHRKIGSYAKIDFDRTKALSNTTRPVAKDEGSRKTRHNSSIGDIP